MKVVIIGGGPAGMLSAISAGTNKNDVTILEKMNMLGRKLLITGKGRCNITSSIPIDEFIKNVPGNGKFLYSCLNNFTNEDILNILKEEGLQTKVERGNRVFPITDKSQDVLQALLNRLKKLKVKIEVGANVKEILTEQDIVNGVKYIQGGKEKVIKADKVILATGGKSYSATGSTGDGYELAKKVGHTVTEIKPSLVPISTKGKDLEICRRMQGLSLKNVAIKIKDAKNNKIIYEDFGEMIFTHFGVSGPVILSGSAHLLRYKKEDIRQGNIKLIIDLKPALDIQKLDDRILRDFSLEKNKIFITNLGKCTQVDARPLPDKVFKEYLSLIEKEIELVNPKIIILFGNQVSSIFLDEKISVSTSRKKKYIKEINNKKYSCFPVYYPIGNGRFNIDKSIEDILWIKEVYFNEIHN